MLRRYALMIVLALPVTMAVTMPVLGASPVWAQVDAVDPMAAPYVIALRQEGYQGVTVEQTWLGRLRIIAFLDGRRREIILHPTSGEVLRDVLDPPVVQTASDGNDSAVATTKTTTIAAAGVMSSARGGGQTDGDDSVATLGAVVSPGEDVSSDPSTGATTTTSDDDGQP